MVRHAETSPALSGGDVEVRTSEEILRNRDRFRWHLE
jgi:hypothetical protein